jgi:hypothetical protein
MVLSEWFSVYSCIGFEAYKTHHPDQSNQNQGKKKKKKNKATKIKRKYLHNIQR